MAGGGIGTGIGKGYSIGGGGCSIGGMAGYIVF
jgi:hypothetical protein